MFGNISGLLKGLGGKFDPIKLLSIATNLVPNGKGKHIADAVLSIAKKDPRPIALFNALENSVGILSVVMPQEEAQRRIEFLKTFPLWQGAKAQAGSTKGVEQYGEQLFDFLQKQQS